YSFRAKMVGQKFLVPQTILQSQQHRLFVQQRRNKIDKIGIGSHLNRDDHQITRTNFFGRIVAIDRRDSKNLAFATNENAVAQDFAQIAAHQKMDITSAMDHLCSVVGSNLSLPDQANPDSHLTSK